MLKLQEKVILWHMQNDLNISHTTSKRQYGFKKGCSTEAALHKVTNMIERRIAKKGYVLGVFLDIEAAFDNVSFKAIATAISKTKLDPATAHLIINMVANRYITINHKEATKTIRIHRGCPQGGILSPFLWNLVVDDLLSYSPKDTPCYLAPGLCRRHSLSCRRQRPGGHLGPHPQNHQHNHKLVQNKGPYN